MILLNNKDNHMTEDITSKQDQISRHDYWSEKVKAAADAQGHNSHILESTKPHKAIKILMMLEEQASCRQIIDAVGTNYQAIYNLKSRHSGPIQERRKEFSRRFATITETASDLLFKKMAMLEGDDDELKKTPLKDIALVMAISADKGSQMDGMPTVTIEHRKGSSIDDAAKMIAEARARIANKIKDQAIEAEVIES